MRGKTTSKNCTCKSMTKNYLLENTCCIVFQRCKTLNTFKKTTLKGGTDNKHDPKKFGSKINHSNLVSKFNQI